jgi:hypothetical protein
MAIRIGISGWRYAPWRGGFYPALALFAVAGCQSPALLRTARTLPAGGNDLSLSFNLSHVSAHVVDDANTLARAVPTSFNYPNPVPDILYSHGMSDDVELGARVSLGSGLFELDAKVRYLETAQNRLHAALAPALGYRVLGIVNGPVVTLPALITYDVSPWWSLSGGVLASYASYDVARGLSSDEANLSGNTWYLGGGAGVELRGGRFHVMPAVELQHSVSRSGTAARAPRIDVLFLSLTIGVGPDVRH